MFLAGAVGTCFHKNTILSGVTMVLALVALYRFTKVFGDGN